MKSYFPAQILLSADFTEELEKLHDVCKSIKKVVRPDKTNSFRFPLLFQGCAHLMNQNQIQYQAHSKKILEDNQQRLKGQEEGPKI